MEYGRKLPVCVRIHGSFPLPVVQIAGEDAGGIFTFAFTTFGQHMFMMAYSGIRPFQTPTPEENTPLGITWGCGS